MDFRKEKKTTILERKYFIYGLSFLLPVLLAAAAYGGMGMYPFGEKSVLIMDMSAENVHFFASLREVLSDPGSLLYSWSKGMGGNYMGVFAFFASSPLSFLTLLFPAEALTEALLFLSILRPGLCGLAFAVYGSYVFRKTDVRLLIASVCYSLISYNVVYGMSMMWLDGVFLLPLVLLGIEKLWKENKYGLLLGSLVWSFVSNYYISYMIGGFGVLYFIYRRVTAYTGATARETGKKFLQFVGTAVLGAGLSAWILLPAAFSLFQGKFADAPEVSFGGTAFSLLELVNKFVIGGYDTIKYDGSPNLYSGLLMLVLLGLYLGIQDIRKSKKIAGICFLGLLYASLYVRALNLVWHVFREPNWFPFRYSFLVSFFMIYLAYETLLHLEQVSKKAFVWTGAGAVLFILWAFWKRNAVVTVKMCAVTAVLLLCYFCMLYVLRSQGADPETGKGKGTAALKKGLSLCLLLAVCGEMCLNGFLSLRALDREFGYEERAGYAGMREALSPLIEAADQREEGFFRMEKTFERSKNDALSLGYHGVTHYSSAYDYLLNQYVRSMGMAQDWMWSGYYGSTVLTDSILNIRYVMSDTPVFEDYEPVKENQGITLYENPYALELGFMVSEELLEDYQAEGSYLHNQEHLLGLMTGSREELFAFCEPEETILSNLSMERGESETLYRQADGGSAEESMLTYQVTVPEDGPFYAAFPTYCDDEYDSGLYVNGTRISDIFTSDTKGTHYLGMRRAGEKLTISIGAESGQFTMEEPVFGVLRMEAFQRQIEELKKQQWQITESTATHLEGTVTATEEKSLLFTSIPYDGAWRVQVDGKTVKQQAFSEALLVVSLEPGTHTITMDYSPEGFRPGVLISLGTAAGMALYYFIKRRGS